jgi:hypothetical protein
MIKANSTLKEQFVWEWMDNNFLYSYHIRDFDAIYTIWAGLDDLDKASPMLNDTTFWFRYKVYEHRSERVYNESGLPHNDTIWENLKNKFEEVKQHREHKLETD